MSVIRVEHLTKAFGELRAVDDLSFSVEEGEIFGLVGPDGAGKTTTMRMLTAIMEPTAGEAWVVDRHVVRDAEAIKEDIGYMSQRFGLYPDLTVAENIDFYADIYDVPRRGRAEKIERLLGFSNLTPFRKRLAGNLSGGMKQKLGLACALIHTPKVLFLDEPTNGVDPVSRRDFWRILYQLLRERVTIFVSTAYLDEAERANRLALIGQGRLLACGTPDEVKQLMRGTILEVQSPRAREATAVLRERLEAESIGLFGDRVHVVSLRPEEAEKETRAILAEAGLPVMGIEAVEPSLEDVFVSVLGKGRKDEGAGSTTVGEAQPSPPDTRPSSPATRHPSPATDSSSPAAASQVVVHELERRFGSFVAVNRVSFDVRRGEIFGFLGPNGAGKSTTIRMLCGILSPTGGTGTVAGFDIRTQAEQIKRHIGYMSQKFSLYEDLTVEENIDFYAGIYCLSPERTERRKEWVLEMAGLREHRRARTSVLSGGWKQRLALGCAILHEPPIVFLDEPTSGVDPLSRRRFWELIYSMADAGVTVFVTTHYMDEAEYCDRLGLIYRGELIALGTPEELKTRLMQEEILEVVCERGETAMEHIERLPAVKEVALFGRGLHVVAKDGKEAAAQISALLEREGFGVSRIEKITASLEDVFVSLIEARDRAERPQEEFRR
jgi:ABC-2 type transport system ATP-binding protein